MNGSTTKKLDTLDIIKLDLNLLVSKFCSFVVGLSDWSVIFKPTAFGNKNTT